VATTTAGVCRQRIEQPLLLRIGMGGALRMPLHADNPGGRILKLDRLDASVFCSAGHDEPSPRFVDGLMVPAPGRIERSSDTRNSGAGFNIDAMQRSAVGVPTVCGVEMLAERAAQRHVQHLHPPTDRQRRDACTDGGPREGELQRIAQRFDPVHLGMSVLAVVGWINIPAADQHQPVHARQQIVSFVIRQCPGSDHCFETARSPHRLQIASLHHRSRQISPSADFSRLPVSGRNCDQWAWHNSSFAQAAFRRSGVGKLRSMTDLPFHRRTWMTLEPIHGMVYFSPLANDIYSAIGLEGREGYFASRSAAMGEVSAEMVISTFFNFAPGVVRSAIPSAWKKASAQTILEARNKVVVDTLAAHTADHVRSDATREAARLAKPIALRACEQVDGRPLFAGHASLPWPSDDQPELVLWHAQTLLREFRGDGHIASLVAEGLSGIDAHVTHIATQLMPVDIMRGTRAWPDDQFEAAVESLTQRGLVQRLEGGVLALTEAGSAQRDRIEALTDTLAAAPYQAAGEDVCTSLRRAARPLAQAVVDAGLSPLRKLPPAVDGA
jgi:hypothetical protein